MKTYEKLDNQTIKIIEEVVETKQVVSTYVYVDLVSRRDLLVVQKTEFNDKIDVEIAEANKAISEAKRLNIEEVIAVAEPIAI